MEISFVTSLREKDRKTRILFQLLNILGFQRSQRRKILEVSKVISIYAIRQTRLKQAERRTLCKHINSLMQSRQIRQSREYSDENRRKPQHSKKCLRPQLHGAQPKRRCTNPFFLIRFQ